MAKTAMEHMLGSMGIDVPKIVEDFTMLKDTVIKTLGALDQKIQRIEKRQEETWQLMTELHQRSTQKPQPQPQLQPMQQPAEQQPKQEQQQTQPNQQPQPLSTSANP